MGIRQHGVAADRNQKMDRHDHRSSSKPLRRGPMLGGVFRLRRGSVGLACFREFACWTRNVDRRFWTYKKEMTPA